MKLSRDKISDLLCTALYGNCLWTVDNTTNEYLKAMGETIEDKLADILLSGQNITLIDTEEDEAYSLSLEELYRGIELFIENGGSSNIEEYDFNDADDVLQYALFGQIVWI
ncbi:MAG: hypothetical protein ACI35S_05455 [Anaeroplasma sp.]